MRVWFLLFLLFLPKAVSAQPFVPDNRYDGYPRSLVNMTATPPDLITCVASEYYEPLDLHLVSYETRVKVASVRVQEYDECTWMLTRDNWRWVLRPAGTKVAIDDQGRDLFDFGSPKGNKCANPRPYSVVIKPVAPPTPAPPAVLLPAPVSIEPLRPFSFRRYVPPPPPPTPAPPAPSPTVEKKRNWKKFVGVALVAGAIAWGMDSKWGNTEPKGPIKNEGPGKPPQ